jgi:hypothetical protein
MLKKTLVNIQVLDDERKAWNRYAEAHDQTVSQLIRAFMNGLVTGKVDPPPLVGRINEQEAEAA